MYSCANKTNWGNSGAWISSSCLNALTPPPPSISTLVRFSDSTPRSQVPHKRRYRRLIASTVYCLDELKCHSNPHPSTWLCQWLYLIHHNSPLCQFVATSGGRRRNSQSAHGLSSLQRVVCQHTAWEEPDFQQPSASAAASANRQWSEVAFRGSSRDFRLHVVQQTHRNRRTHHPKTGGRRRPVACRTDLVLDDVSLAGRRRTRSADDDRHAMMSYRRRRSCAIPIRKWNEVHSLGTCMDGECNRQAQVLRIGRTKHCFYH